jgi:Zn-dependent protease with chaperone function
MIEFHGTYFDGRTSRAQPATAFFDGESLHVRGEAWSSEALHAPVSDFAIAPPLGRTHRSLMLPDGARLETADLNAIEAMEKLRGVNRGLRIVNTLESHWKAVAGCLVGLALFVWLFTIYGIPTIAGYVARSIPPSVMERVSRETLKTLDKGVLAPSDLSPARTEEVRRAFDGLRKQRGAGFDYRLEFRKGGHFGANAFALPSGIIVVTDELVALARNDRELTGVLVHEMAHVQKRHAVRSILQNSGVFLLVSVVFGDVASLTSLIGSLPVLLIETGYSRAFEREADREAGLYCIEKGWTTKPYRDILQRLSRDEGQSRAMSAFSTHPVTKERVKILIDLELSKKN